MWSLDEQTASLAKWLTALLVAVGTAWKVFLRVRRDARGDQADGAATDGWQLIVDGQKAEISRLHESLKDLAARVEAEIAVRRQMEVEASALRRRLDQAESAAERAFARQRACEEVVEIFRAQVAALEMQVEELEKARDAKAAADGAADMGRRPQE